MREYYDGDMKNKKWSDDIFRQAVSVGHRALKEFLNPEKNEIEAPVGEPIKDRKRAAGHSGRFFLI